jgi:hypothetical protein
MIENRTAQIIFNIMQLVIIGNLLLYDIKSLISSSQF